MICEATHADRVRRRPVGEVLRAVYAPLPLAESLATSLRGVAALAAGYLALESRSCRIKEAAITANARHALAEYDLERHRPEGDWPTVAMFREGVALVLRETTVLVWPDILYACHWAGNMLSVREGNETHEE